jgi:hypothetical protein
MNVTSRSLSISYVYLSGPLCIQYYNPVTFLYVIQQSLGSSGFSFASSPSTMLLYISMGFVFTLKIRGFFTEKSWFIGHMEVMLPETSFLASALPLRHTFVRHILICIINISTFNLIYIYIFFCFYWSNGQFSFWWMARIVTVPLTSIVP